ncbi:Tis11 [Symbiodinium natans]|uniref:Tis11 protein n=1 Tax=Symbiodinium natans TaxID=878477 RepID=A0A812NTU3_9DINO|nr:Tis11 [Symbiodinium natans]
MTKSEQKKAVQFTRMCKFWRTNECKMGADCTFAHASSELRPSPKPCFEFSKIGSCVRGQACRFVHSGDGMKISEKPHGYVFAGAGAKPRTPIAPMRMRVLIPPDSLPFRPPPGLEDIGIMFGLEGEGPCWSSEIHMDGDSGSSRRSSLSDMSLSMDLMAASWKSDGATAATQSGTSSMCLSTTPSSFSKSDSPEGTAFWI